MRTTLITLLILLLPLTASAGYSVTLDRGTGRAVNAEVLGNFLIASVDGTLIAIDLGTADIFGLLTKLNVSYLTRSRTRLLGLGTLEGSAVIAVFNDVSNVVMISLGPQPTLYDAVNVDGLILGTGYVTLNGTYRLLLLRVEGPSVLAYVASCHIACYGRRLIHIGSDTFVVGSTYLRSDVYGWNYDIFVGKLVDSRYVVGRYVEVGGNDYVVNAYSVNGLLYVIVNSDLSGMYVAVFNPVTYDTVLYRVTIATSPVTCRSTAMLGDQLLLLVEHSGSGSRYLVVIDTTSLSVNAYVSHDVVALDTAGDGLIALLVRGASFRDLLHVLNVSELNTLLRGYDVVKAQVSTVRAKALDLRFVLESYSISYSMVEERLYMRNLGTAGIWATAPITSATPEGSPYGRPLYEPYRDKRGDVPNLTLLVAGIVLVTTSIILKYVANARGDRS